MLHFDHCGQKELVRRISSEYYWPKLASQVEDFVHKCHACQVAKVGKVIKFPISQIEVPERRFSHLNLDIIGPLPKSRGYRYIFSIFCRTSRFFQAIPLEKADAESCTWAFLNHWLSFFSLPTKATSDNGNTFISQVWKGLQDSLGIKVEFTPRYRPQANAGVERQHQSLKNSLKAALIDLGDTHRERWADVLPWMLMGRRAAYQPELGCSPFQMTFGQASVLPGTMLGEVGNPPSKSELESLRENLESEQDRPPIPMARHGIGPQIYTKDTETASHVYLKSENPQGLQPRWHGPYLINKRLGDSTIEVRTGTFKDKTPRLEMHSWNNAKPAYMGENAVEAERPKLGRPPKISDASASDIETSTATLQTANEKRDSENSRPSRVTRNPNPQYVWSATPADIAYLNKSINTHHSRSP